MKIKIKRVGDVVDVVILRNKNDNTYSFVNLTKSHICPCRFLSVSDAIDDLCRYDNILSWEIVDENQD